MSRRDTNSPMDSRCASPCTNITNEDPPFVNTGLPENTDPGSYRLLGRTYFIKLLYHF